MRFVRSVLRLLLLLAAVVLGVPAVCSIWPAVQEAVTTLPSKESSQWCDTLAAVVGQGGDAMLWLLGALACLAIAVLLRLVNVLERF